MQVYEDTPLYFNLKTIRNIPLTSEQIMRHGYDLYDLMGALEGYELTPEDMVDALNWAYDDGLIYLRNWRVGGWKSDDAVDCIGEDSMGNAEVLTIGISHNTEGRLRFTLKNASNGISHSVSDMFSRPESYSQYELMEEFDECGWDADAFCDVLDRIRDEGKIYNRDWCVRRETPIYIVLGNTDSFGNQFNLIVRQ